MHHQITVTQSIPAGKMAVPSTTPASSELTDLLKQILEVNREQAQMLRTLVAAQDHSARWKAFLARWQGLLPNLGDQCRQALPSLESAFGKVIHELSQKLTEDSEVLDEEFCLQEFLDRYGNRISQLGTMLNMVSPLADAAPAKDPPTPLT